MPIGTQICVQLGKSKPGAMIPTTVGGAVERDGLPRIAGSAPKRRGHRPSLRIATRLLPRVASSGRNLRPWAASRPSRSKNSERDVRALEPIGIGGAGERETGALVRGDRRW
jgi:hypothetical protein